MFPRHLPKILVLFYLILHERRNRKMKLHIVLRPWTNGDASQRKFGNANLRTQTCDGWPNGIASRRKLYASCKKDISVQPRVRARTKETILKPTYLALRCVAKRWKTCVHLNANFSSIKVDASYRKPRPNRVASCHVFNLRKLATPFGRASVVLPYSYRKVKATQMHCVRTH